MNSITSTLPADLTTSSPSSTATTKAADTQNQFLQLLVAQLKGQNPLNPMDGTQFVSQLAQFSSLEELTGIHTSVDAIEQGLVPSTPGADPANSVQSST